MQIRTFIKPSLALITAFFRLHQLFEQLPQPLDLLTFYLPACARW